MKLRKNEYISVFGFVEGVRSSIVQRKPTRDPNEIFLGLSCHAAQPFKIEVCLNMHYPKSTKVIGRIGLGCKKKPSRTNLVLSICYEFTN